MHVQTTLPANRLLGKKKCEITSHLSTIAGNAAKSKGSLMSKKQLPALDSIMHYTADIGAATDVKYFFTNHNKIII